MLKSFSSTLAHLPGSFSHFQSRYSVENPFAPASEERNSVVDVIAGVLKRLTAESCVLQVCKFLIRNPIKDRLLGISCKFKASERNFIRSSFLVAYKLYIYIASLYSQLKGDSSKFLEKQLFETYDTMKVSVTSLKDVFTRPCPTNFKFLKTNKGNICAGVGLPTLKQVEKWKVLKILKVPIKSNFVHIYSSFKRSSFILKNSDKHLHITTQTPCL